MALNNIENLLEKYNNAETSLEEEAHLRVYFKSDAVAPHLEHYRMLFAYFSESQQEQYTKNVPLKTKKTTLYKWISVAAVIVLMLSFIVPKLFTNETKTLDMYTLEEQQTYLEAKAALAMLSSNFNEGATSLNTLNTASLNFNVGLKNANHITQFGKQTNELLKN